MFLSSSEVVIFSGYNDYKQDWFVCFLSTVPPGRKWVWGLGSDLLLEAERAMSPEIIGWILVELGSSYIYTFT